MKRERQDDEEIASSTPLQLTPPQLKPTTRDAILQVFTTRDLVVDKLAPLLDLLSLFNLSRVNLRLRQLLSRTTTLQIATKYRGSAESDLPGTFLEYPDKRVTAYMTTRKTRPRSNADPMRQYFGVRGVAPWEDSVHIVVTGDARADIVEHHLKHLVLPFVRDSKLPNAQLTAHLELLYPVLFGLSFDDNYTFKRRFSVETRDLFRLLILVIAHRVQSGPIVLWHCNLYRESVARYAGIYPSGVWDIALLYAQGGGNKVGREALLHRIGQLGMRPQLDDRTLLLAATGSNPAFFDAEYARVKSLAVSRAVPVTDLLVCASFWESEDMFFHILNTLGSEKILRAAWVILRDFSKKALENAQEVADFREVAITGSDITAMYSLVRTIEMGKRGLLLVDVVSALYDPINPEAVRARFLVALVEWSGRDACNKDELTQMDEKMNVM